MMNIDALKALYYDIEKYGKYLEESTYCPYDEVQRFAHRLKTIIDEADEKGLNIGSKEEPEIISPDEYFEQWFSYAPPEDKTFRMCFFEGMNFLEKKLKKSVA